MKTMYATVLSADTCSLLVCDHNTAQEVIVRTPRACCFCEGDWVCICFNGQMTMSIPPQITATRITRITRCR